MFRRSTVKIPPRQTTLVLNNLNVDIKEGEFLDIKDHHTVVKHFDLPGLQFLKVLNLV